MEILLFFHAKNIAIHIAIQIKILQYIAIRNFQPIPSPTHFTQVLNSVIQMFCIESREYKIANTDFSSYLLIVYICQRDFKICEMCFSWFYADINSLRSIRNLQNSSFFLIHTSSNLFKLTLF